MLPSPFSQGCYGDVSFFFYILGASSNVFFFPFLLVFLLSFVSDWLFFYVEDAAIVLPQRGEVLSCRVCLLAGWWMWLGIGRKGIVLFLSLMWPKHSHRLHTLLTFSPISVPFYLSSFSPSPHLSSSLPPSVPFPPRLSTSGPLILPPT